MKKLLKTLLIISSLVSLAFALTGCEEVEEQTFEKIDGDYPDRWADSLLVVQTKGEYTEYEMFAVHMDTYSNKKLTLADTVTIRVFDKQGLLQTTLTCDKARIDDVKNTFTGTGNVIVNSENGNMQTEFLMWFRTTDELVAKEGVKVTRGENILWGEEMKTDINLDRIEITKVSAEGKIDEDDFDF